MLEERTPIQPWLPMVPPPDPYIVFTMDRILCGAAVVTAEKEKNHAQP